MKEVIEKLREQLTLAKKEIGMFEPTYNRVKEEWEAIKKQRMLMERKASYLVQILELLVTLEK